MILRRVIVEFDVDQVEAGGFDQVGVIEMERVADIGFDETAKALQLTSGLILREAGIDIVGENARDGIA